MRPAAPTHTPANSGVTKNGRLGSTSNNFIHKTQNGPVSQAQNGVATSVSKPAVAKHAAAAVHANLSGEGIQSISVPKMMEK